MTFKIFMLYLVILSQIFFLNATSSFLNPISIIYFIILSVKLSISISEGKFDFRRFINIDESNVLGTKRIHFIEYGMSLLYCFINVFDIFLSDNANKDFKNISLFIVFVLFSSYFFYRFLFKNIIVGYQKQYD